MQRYKVTIEYHGTLFHGWQRQKNLISVQESLENALLQFAQKEVTTWAAGRTDAGVHARGQVAHFNLERQYSKFEMMLGLNYFLKETGATILDVELVDSNFHARFSAKGRAYEYIIINRRAPLTFQKDLAWVVFAPLDVELMKEGVEYFVGTHDFTSFRATGCQANSPIRTLTKAHVDSYGEEIRLSFEAPSFLHHQVRNMVGTLAYVGQGKWKPCDIKTAFEKRERRAGGPTAPPQGLYFTKVFY